MNNQPAGIYIRVSSRIQETDGASLGTQEQSCQRFAQEQGFDLLADQQYREIHTGTELWERPELTRLRAAMARGQFRHLICHSIDRLSRDPVHLGVILLDADRYGVQVHFVTERLDDSAEGQLIQYVRGYAAKIEHEKIRERTMRGRRARAESGRLMPGATALYGYHWRDELKTAYDPDPICSRIVQRIYGEYLDGYSLRQIAARLTDDRIPTPRGNQGWDLTMVRRILRHRGYSGRAYAMGFRKQPGKTIDFDPAAAIELPVGTIPPLVSIAQWEQAQARLEQNRHGATVTARVPMGAVLLRGAITCGLCGSAMAPECSSYRPKNAPDDYQLPYQYRCRDSAAGFSGSGCRRCSIRAGIIDAAAWDRALYIVSQPQIIAAQLERMRADDSIQRDLASVDAAMRQLAKQRTNLAAVAAQLDDPDDAAPLLEQLKQAGERSRQLTAEREQIAARQANWEQSQALLGEFSRWGQHIAANAAELSFADRQRLVRLLGIRAVVYRGDAAERFIIHSEFDLALVAGERFDSGESLLTSSGYPRFAKIPQIVAFQFPASMIQGVAAA